MARTPLLSGVQGLARAVAMESTPPSRLLSRRTLLKASAVGLGAGAVYRLARPAEAASQEGPRIVVVGGGLAGLTTAYQLRKAGYAARVFEAADRLGGRCWTARGAFAAGQIVERGGELIDQGHTQLLQLAKELGLSRVNLLAAEPSGSEPIYYFDGARYDYAAAKGDLQGIWQQLHSDASAASYPTLYNLSTQRGRELDRMSVRKWIDNYVPGGITSRLGQLLDVAYTIEYGADSAQQSALNLIYLLAYQGPGNIRLFGKSNEKYHIVGGNDQVVHGMAAALPGQIQLGTALRALAKRGDGTWAVTVGPATGVGSSTTVIADRVVLALPFSLLRAVDLSAAGFPKLKMRAIAESRIGVNTKLHLQFTRRYWYDLGSNGESYADTGYQSTWEVTRGQDGTPGILVNYTGGTIGGDFSKLSPSQYGQRFLGQLDPAMPGISRLWNGGVLLDDWKSYPWTRGAYSYWGVGQYTTIAGAEREAVGSCHFAGEHTSVDFQGFLNGAVESGARAAQEIIAAVG